MTLRSIYLLGRSNLSLFVQICQKFRLTASCVLNFWKFICLTNRVLCKDKETINGALKFFWHSFLCWVYIEYSLNEHFKKLYRLPFRDLMLTLWKSHDRYATYKIRRFNKNVFKELFLKVRSNYICPTNNNEKNSRLLEKMVWINFRTSLLSEQIREWF